MNSSRKHADTFGADVLRGVAILLVVSFHAFGAVWYYYPTWLGWLRDFSTLPNRWYMWLYPMTLGWAGVPLFFVISGFCIHYSYLRSSNFAVGEFFWRRFWRIYPAYIVALIAFAASPWADWHSKSHVLQIASHASLLHNLSQSTFFGINGSFWSIAVEVQLYLLFPLLLMLRTRLGISKTLAVIFFIGCVWRVGVLVLMPLPGHLIHAAWTAPLAVWFDWALGALVAERFMAGRTVFHGHRFWAYALVPAFFMSTLFKPTTCVSFTMASLLSAVALDAALHAPWRFGLASRALAFIGDISYSLYLWHQPLLFPIVGGVAAVTGSRVVGWVALGPILIAASWLSFHVLERPGMALGHALWRRWQGTASAARRAVRTWQRGANPVTAFPSLDRERIGAG